MCSVEKPLNIWVAKVVIIGIQACVAAPVLFGRAFVKFSGTNATIMRFLIGTGIDMLRVILHIEVSYFKKFHI